MLTMQPSYNVYKPNELMACLDTVTDKNEEVQNFFATFSFSKILNQNIDKGNSNCKNICRAIIS